MKSLIPACFIVGVVMALTGAVAYGTGWLLAPYIYSVGALLVAFAQICTPVRSQNTTIRRLRNQQLLGALLLVLSGGLMIFAHNNEWILSLTVAAMFELYTAFRIPHEEEKEQRQK